MALKDLINNLRDYFVDEEEDFEENDKPRAVKPTIVQTAPKTSAEEKRETPTPKSRPVSQPQRPQWQQPQSRPQARSTQPKAKAQVRRETTTTTTMNQTQTAPQQAQVAGTTIAIKEPRAYTDIMEAARIVKNGECVIVNFKYMGDGQARRSIDFMTGVAFTLDGDIQNVGGQIFLMTPAHISVEAAKEMSMLAGQNFESYDLY